jgi:hypothetical protein
VVRVLVFCTALLVLALQVRAEEYYTVENPFHDALTNMFDIVEQPYIPMEEGGGSPPPPDVPLDGGLVALIAAGGIAGYRRLRARQTHTV